MTATSNMVRSLLSEFGFNIPKEYSAFKRCIIEILEGGQSSLPNTLREHVANAFHLHETLAKERADLEMS